jgi:hypothetical protein
MGLDARHAGFERLCWDDAHILGPTPKWGDWRAAPAMDGLPRPS